MNFNRSMVALDLSDMDQKLATYSAFIAESCACQAIDFVHVVPSSIPSLFDDKNIEVLIGEERPLRERIKGQLVNTVQPLVDDLKGVEVGVSLLTGKPLEELLRAVEKKEPDLLVLGKKQISKGSGVNARRVAEKANTDIWFVTEKATAEVKNILVPVDFSDNSFRALKAALALKDRLKHPTVTALHAIDIPMTAYKINRNKDTIVAKLKASATNRYRLFLSQNQIERKELELKLVLNDEFDIARYIQKVARAEKSDLIVIGGKGHSFLDNFLFGSVTEKLVTYEYEIPVLVIR